MARTILPSISRTIAVPVAAAISSALLRALRRAAMAPANSGLASSNGPRGVLLPWSRVLSWSNILGWAPELSYTSGAFLPRRVDLAVTRDRGHIERGVPWHHGARVGGKAKPDRNLTGGAERSSWRARAVRPRGRTAFPGHGRLLRSRLKRPSAPTRGLLSGSDRARPRPPRPLSAPRVSEPRAAA